MKKLWASAAMLIATVLWGVAFSAQAGGMKYIEPMLFTALRSLVGVLALLVVIAVFDLVRFKRLTWWGQHAASSADRRFLLTGGLYCGVVISLASACQQYGIKYISAGKTGFLTALYIVIVPLIGLFFKRKTTLMQWAAVATAMLGTYLLCGGVGNINIGESFVIGCAVIYSIHVLVIDHYAPRCDCVRLSCIQFMVATVLTAVGSLLMREDWVINRIVAALPFWIFCGVGSSAIAFTLQMAAQKYLHPVTAALLMSLESVFAVAGGWLFLHEKLSAPELAGCIVIFIAVIIAQLPVKRKSTG